MKYALIHGVPVGKPELGILRDGRVISNGRGGMVGRLSGMDVGGRLCDVGVGKVLIFVVEC